MVDIGLIYKKIYIARRGRRNTIAATNSHSPSPMEMRGVFPHMHTCWGAIFKLTATPPEGEPLSLLWINDWDFNWQSFYEYETPVKLPAGTKIVMETIHDNSAENFAQPEQPAKAREMGRADHGRNVGRIGASRASAQEDMPNCAKSKANASSAGSMRNRPRNRSRFGCRERRRLWIV